MNNSRYLKTAIGVFILFIASDLLWHTYLLGDFYEARLSAINGQPSPVAFPWFVLAYEIIAALGMTYFLQRALHGGSATISDGFWKGALLGLMMATTINFVNHSLILHWDATLTLIDTAWGTATGAIVGLFVAWMRHR